MSLASYFQSAAANSKSGSPLSRYTDIVLVAGIVAIIALMIVPLPNWAIDILVAVNISGGILLLLLAIYISSPLEFSVFPSVLLISTLFRLALSIATTRMILLHGEAGHIIQTFGDMVAGGNLVVGLVVFLIITVVQFIVIAKGSERVAEVAARFSLDAMPGKQMSIDSDLRSGLIDKDEARRRRRMLENESKLNGSLDGAMKFVKGDAIAGIIIIIINLLGGLTIGVLQQDMTLSDATVKYSILTIGDGMVSQIPALLGAMSAGLLVTRTTDDEHDKHLGDAIGRQLTAKPRVLLMGGGLCVLFSAVPGFPTVVFMALGLAFFAAGFMLTPSLRARWEKLAQPTLSAVMRRSPTAPVLMSAEAVQVRPTVPLLLEVPVGRLDAQESHSLLAGLEGVLDHFQLNLGMRLPRIDVHAMRPDEDKPAVWRLLAYEVPIAEGELQQEDTVPSLVNEVRESLRRHVNLFMGTQEANLLLTRAAIDLPDVVKETLRALPLARVAEILRRLVEEEVAIRNLRDILETLADTAQREKDVYALTELTRIGLKRQISHRYAPDGHLRAVLLEPALEEMLRNAIRHNSGAQQLALDPLEMSRLMTRFRNVVQVFKPAAIVTAVDIRRHVRKLIEQDCFDIPVLSYHELLPSLQLEALHRVSTEDAPLLEAGS
ncbi:type III secretion protein [Ottowia sp. oral taxon 894]|uniref:flagellar biosynthesis protein FlhA n=1 Tax=Ottowia sp. oral taxon 894 TaxID=1658672 RepID=UPI000682CEA3|nr:flagellar biosynthesis protein FlhA [Ottowia sp. oral taxon 894]AKU67347.1 type III secretion protein [Ottowia sp. oral taxon 894]